MLKQQELADQYSDGSSLDAISAWLREVTAEKYFTSERVSNVMTSIYADMVNSYIHENRGRHILKK